MEPIKTIKPWKERLNDLDEYGRPFERDIEAAEAEIADLRAALAAQMTPADKALSDAQYKEWTALAVAAGFNCITSAMQSLAASRVPVAQEDERKAFEADFRKRNSIPDYVSFAGLNPVVTSEAWAAWQARAAIASQSAEPVRQWRTKGEAAWFDGQPPHEYAGSPYETRTLFPAPPAAAPGGDAEQLARMLQSFADRLCKDTSLGEKYEGDESALREAIAYLRHHSKAAAPAPAVAVEALTALEALTRYAEDFYANAKVRGCATAYENIAKLAEAGRAALSVRPAPAAQADDAIARLDAAIAAPKPCSQDEWAAGRSAAKTCVRCGMGGPCTGRSAQKGGA